MLQSGPELLEKSPCYRPLAFQPILLYCPILYNTILHYAIYHAVLHYTAFPGCICAGGLRRLARIWKRRGEFREPLLYGECPKWPLDGSLHGWFRLCQGPFTNFPQLGKTSFGQLSINLDPEGPKTLWWMVEFLHDLLHENLMKFGSIG